MPEINMPRLSDTMQEGTITHWLKKLGDEVKKGDIVAEVETDKANMEIEAFSSGILEQILVNEGDVAPIGQPIAILGTGAQAQGKANVSNAKAAPVQKQKAVVNNVNVIGEEQTSISGQNGNGRGETVKSSPLARRMAEEHGIDLSLLKGTGPAGRIVRDDIEEYLETRSSTPATNGARPIAQPSPQPVTVDEDADIVKLTTMQKTIVRRMTEAKQSVPHFYVSNDIDLTDALAIRQKLNANLDEGGVKISVNDLIVKACALALEKFPEVNGSYKDGQFILPKHINVGIAVDVPGGLLVPVIRDANLKGLRTIARESKALGVKAQSGKLTPADLDGGTFSISNLGMMDVTEFVAIINPPQSAILAVGATRKTFVPIDNQPVVRDIMHVTLSADHRILYGATVARFLQEVKHLLQNIYLILG